MGRYLTRRVNNYSFHDHVVYNKNGFAARRLILAAAQQKQPTSRALNVFFSYERTISQHTSYVLCVKQHYHNQPVNCTKIKIKSKNRQFVSNIKRAMAASS